MMSSHILIFTGAPKIKKNKVFNETDFAENEKDQTTNKLNSFVWRKASFTNYELHSNLVDKFSQESEELSQLTLPPSLSLNNHIKKISHETQKTNKNTTTRINTTILPNIIENNYYDCSQLLFSHQDKEDSIDSTLSVYTPKENDTDVIRETPLSMLKHSSTVQGL